jgi:transcriptional regulator with XRE-family HTH domain
VQAVDDRTSLQLFAWRLRATRRAYGGMVDEPELSARQFAMLLGIQPERYRRYERAELEPPLSVLVALRRMTGVSLDKLIAGDQPGDAEMIPVYGMRGTDTVTLGDRLRWVRALSLSQASQAAAVMKVPEEDWARWEAGVTRPPLDKLHEFAVRFQVTLDFLVAGTLSGLVTRQQQSIRERLVKLHPELVTEAPLGSKAAAPSKSKARAGSGRTGRPGSALPH